MQPIYCDQKPVSAVAKIEKRQRRKNQISHSLLYLFRTPQLSTKHCILYICKDMQKSSIRFAFKMGEKKQRKHEIARNGEWVTRESRAEKWWTKFTRIRLPMHIYIIQRKFFVVIIIIIISSIRKNLYSFRSDLRAYHTRRHASTYIKFISYAPTIFKQNFSI